MRKYKKFRSQQIKNFDWKNIFGVFIIQIEEPNTLKAFEKTNVSEKKVIKSKNGRSPKWNEKRDH